MFRAIVVLGAGAPVLVTFSGLFYSSICIPSCSYGAILLFAILHGGAAYLLLRLAGVGEARLQYWLPVLVVLWLGPFVSGCLDHCQDVKRNIVRIVQRDVSGEFPEAWKNLDADEVIPLYVERITGTRGGGVWGCLRLTAHTGWSGWEFYRPRGSYPVTRTGFWIWFAWLLHLLLFLMAVCAAAGAVLPDHETPPTPVKGRPRPAPPQKRAAPVKAPPVKATPAKKRKPAPTAPPESPPQGRPPNILTADIRPETDDPEPVRWKVSLYFHGRQIELKFLHPEGKPTLRRIMKRLSFETNSVLQAERESRRGETD
ncbi:MAG: hypothetical protein GY859_24530, partial [Desulfobacterales bacterium]|nr:hypothetical protein [Desulfobacterales bacterium]